MMPKIVLGILVLCAVVIQIKSERMPEYTRIKRAKYYSSPPRYFKRPPPVSYGVKGPYSFTPPPNYMMDDEPPYPGHSRPPKVSKRPTNEGLGDEDLNNLVKYLSKQDLDKIIEFAGEKKKSEKYRDGPPSDSFKEYSSKPKKEEIKYIKDEDDNEKFSLNGPYISGNNQKQYDIEYEAPSENIVKESPKFIYVTNPKDIPSHPDYNPNANDNQYYNPNLVKTQPQPVVYVNKPQESADVPAIPYVSNFRDTPNNSVYSNKPLETQESMHSTQYIQKGPVGVPPPPAYLNSQTNTYEPIIPYANPTENSNIQIYSSIPLDTEESMNNNQYVNTFAHPEVGPSGNIITEGRLNEEQLPKPANLREEPDFDISYTNNVPIVVKSDSYKVENFGDLPLMNYNSKLESVSSYHVPHYTVTSPKQKPSSFSISQSTSLSSSSSSSGKVPKLELAPPASSAREQSDAHLKAIKIWTHKSKGTAYTLHNDGSLSLEKPSRPKNIYGS